jgi:triacylglycerol lipase
VIDVAATSTSAPSHTIILDGIWGRPWRWKCLAQRIERTGVGSASIFSYNASGMIPMKSLGQHLLDEIDRQGPADRVNVVAHSMGGLVIRAAHLLRPTLPLRRAVMMCSPLHGSLLAHLLPLPGVRDMKPGSAFLKELQAIEPQWNIRTMTMWTHGDLAVVPGKSARWSKAEQRICFWMPAHNWPRWSGGLQDQVVKFLR